VEKARLAESRKQAENLRKGLTLIIPEGLLNLLTWRELETLVCGKPILDVDLLRQNTVYRVQNNFLYNINLNYISYIPVLKTLTKNNLGLH
jgi:hypothetical protein